MNDDDEPTETRTLTYGAMPDGTPILVVDGVGLHPDQRLFDLTSGDVAKLIDGAVRQAAEQAAQQALSSGTYTGLAIGTRTGVRLGLRRAAQAIAQSMPDDAA